MSDADRSELHAALAALLQTEPADAGEHGGAVPPPGRRLRCPACGGAMQEVPEGGGQALVDVCLACDGMWLDVGELELVAPDPSPEALPSLEEARVQVTQNRPKGGPEPVSYRPCPICGQLMNRRDVAGVALSGIVIDECRQHGVFLDAGELLSVRRFAKAGGRRLAEVDAGRRQRKDRQMKADRRDATPYIGEQPVRGRREWAVAKAVAQLIERFR